MHAEWYLAQAIHTERLRDLRRRSEATAANDRLRGRRDAAHRLGPEAPVPAERLLEASLARFARDALTLAVRAPSLAGILLRFVRGQRRAARTRAWWKGRGTHVPPVMIASITERCNLHCAGCYAMARGCGEGEELPSSRWTGLFGEAARLGVSFVLVAGGEPFSRGEVIGAARVAPDTLFAVFTNGLLVGPRAIEAIRRSRNVVPVISLEGPQRETDSRRGHGVYRRVMRTMARLRSARLAFGASLTVTSVNLDVVTSPVFLRSLVEAGARILFFVEYSPVEAGTEALALTGAQRAELCRRADAFHAGRRALCVVFPGDEERYGGCLAAGRGFVHVSPQGRLEPCPYAPISDRSVRDAPLADALRSPLFAAIRTDRGRLAETRGGCALRADREWVRRIAAPAVEPAAPASRSA